MSEYDRDLLIALRRPVYRGDHDPDELDPLHIQAAQRIEELLAVCALWDQGFSDGEDFTAAQFLEWVNRNRRTVREAVAKTKGEG